MQILREVAGQCRNPALLFSGGKDSVCLLALAEKAFRPGPFPFPLLHINTGHNLPEVAGGTAAHHHRGDSEVPKSRYTTSYLLNSSIRTGLAPLDMRWSGTFHCYIAITSSTQAPG